MTDETIGEVEETVTGRFSRRTALKGIGAGAVVAWTAPTVLSATPALAAAGSSSCSSPCSTCFEDGVSSACGSTQSGVGCLCSSNAEGDCTCSADEYGVEGSGSTCTSSADCASGESCVSIAAYGCGSPQSGGATCLPNCGSGAAIARARAKNGTHGTRPSGRKY